MDAFDMLFADLFGADAVLPANMPHNPLADSPAPVDTLPDTRIWERPSADYTRADVIAELVFLDWTLNTPTGLDTVVNATLDGDTVTMVTRYSGRFTFHAREYVRTTRY